MAKTRVQKETLVNAYATKLKESKGIIVLKPNAITPNEASQIKKDLFDSNAEYNVVKNTLFSIALEKANLEKIETFSYGEHAIIFMSEDIVSPSKAINAFIEKTYDKVTKTNKFTIVGGFLDGATLTAAQVQELADMPTIQGSVSMILGILDNAMSSVVNVLEDAPRSMASIIDQAFN